MRVTILDRTEGGGILVDGTSLDHNSGVVLLEYDQLQPGHEYVIRYDLYDKEIVANAEDLTEMAVSGTGLVCKLPFVTQELLILDKSLAKHRVQEYNRIGEKDAKDLQTQGLDCGFDHLNNTKDSEYGEDGVFCELQTYTYNAPYNTNTGHGKVNLIYEHAFSVRGAKNELITYWYEMLIGINFMASSSLKIVLARNDQDFDENDPYKCLYDRSCILATLSQKNQLKIDVILTSGLYKLLFIDEETNQMRRFLSQDASLTKRPFTFKLTSYPVLQNEERYVSCRFNLLPRVNCGFMYMENDFIQNRFIDGK